MNRTGDRQNSFYNVYIKRLLDILCAALVLLLLCWLYLILALLVRVKLGKPVLFRQRRPGRIDPATGKETIFTLYKFRTMSDQRDADGNLLPDHLRLTRFGHILRASSLDELPEFWNILKGDMSFVGPRPWEVPFLAYYTPEEHRRHLVRPGLTGLAQVNGRTAINWDERLKYDIEYVDYLSFALDMKILFRTFKKIFSYEEVVDTEEQMNFDDFRKQQWADGAVPMPPDVQKRGGA